ncbi:MAG TPA: TldD/PmbA family protein [Gemmatimonadales bacterium]|nr:TldD/PmbA family protein [Gemmatimonadales bacterium]
MPWMNEAEARALLEKVLKLSQADACEANLNGSVGGNIRYARNTVSTAGGRQDTTLVIQSSFGKRAGSVTVNEYDDATLARAVRRSEELARLAPEDPEFMEPLGPQQYVPVQAFHERTAAITPEFRAQAAATGIAAAKAHDCTAAGYLEDSATWQAMANSKGLFAYHQETVATLQLTVRANDGTGSGFAGGEAGDVAKLDVRRASDLATQKAVASRNPVAIEPGKYTVILEPLAAVDLLQYLVFGLNARNADEGRSFLSKAGGGTRLGERLVDERVTIYSDPAHPEVATSPWSADGRPQVRRNWIERGVVKHVFYSRYWAARQQKEAVPFPANFIMEGGTQSVDDMVKSTPRGILVTRTWYIRFVDPQTLLLTGLTRDGTFYIEDGRIKHAVKNFRFNESPVIMLNNLDALGRPERVRNIETGVNSLVPPMRIRDFTFTSLSDAI